MKTTYSEREIDLLEIYCSELDRCYLLPIDLVARKHEVRLRLTPPRNGQVACITLAEDFEFDGAIAQLGERLRGTQEVAGSSPASSTSRSSSDSPPRISVGSNPLRDRLGYWMELVAGGRGNRCDVRGKPRIRVSPAVA
jgi:hypothetical protein